MRSGGTGLVFTMAYEKVREFLRSGWPIMCYLRTERRVEAENFYMGLFRDAPRNVSMAYCYKI